MSVLPIPWNHVAPREPADRTTPHNIEAEMGVLGCVLQNPATLALVKTVLRGPDDFFRDTHQLVYRGVLALESAGTPIDPITLGEELDRRGQLVEVGGIEGLMELVNSVPHEVNAGYYAGIVRENAVKRDVIEAASEVLRDAYANDCTAGELVERASRAIARVEQEVKEPGWQAPDPCGGLPAPPFPLDVLPEGLARFVGEVAASIPCPPDFAAVPALAVAGAAAGRSLAVRVKDGWAEEMNLWAAVVGMPGTAKTPALKAVTRPLYKLQRELLTWHRVECEAIKARLRAAREESKKLGKKGDYEPEEKPPAPRRVVVSDVTTEALASRLADNPRGLLMIGDELAGWLNAMNQYKQGGNDHETYLQLWSRQSIVVDRKGQEGGVPVYVAQPFFGATGGIQPDKLDRVGVGPDGRVRDDGFRDRLLYTFPAAVPTGWRWETVSPESQRDWEDALRRLWGLPLPNEPASGEPAPRRVDMTRDARERYAAWTEAFCGEAEAPDFDESMRGPYSKLRAYCARLALVLESLAWAFDPTADPDGPGVVGVRCVEGSIRLVEYFAAHYRRVLAYVTGNGGENADAEAVLDWLRKRGERRFTAREVRDNFRRRFSDRPEALASALAWLESRDWVRKLPRLRRPAGGRPPTDAFEAHPKLFSNP